MAVAVRRPRVAAPTRRRSGWSRTWLVVAVMLLLAAALLMLLPFIWTLATSFKPEADVVTYPPKLLPTHLTFSHYVDIWHRIPFARLFLNTVIFAGGVTLFSLFFDSLTAYALARLEFPGRNLLFVAILATMMLPFQVTLIPLFDLLTKLDWINSYQGLIAPRATNAFGIFFLRQFFLSLPRDLEEAARVDGAGEFRIYRQIVLPLAGPALLTLALFHFMYNWNDLLWPLLINQDASHSTLPSGLAQFMGQHVVEYGLLMAASVMALLPVIVFFVLIQRHFVEGVATTGIK
jgi:multiple sugar transport system permease protein